MTKDKMSICNEDGLPMVRLTHDYVLLIDANADPGDVMPAMAAAIEGLARGLQIADQLLRGVVDEARANKVPIKDDCDCAVCLAAHFLANLTNPKMH